MRMENAQGDGLGGILYLVLPGGWHPMCAEGMSEEELRNVGQIACQQKQNGLYLSVANVTTVNMYTNLRGVTCYGTEKNVAECQGIHQAPRGKVFNCSEFIYITCSPNSK